VFLAEYLFKMGLSKKLKTRWRNEMTSKGRDSTVIPDWNELTKWLITDLSDPRELLQIAERKITNFSINNEYPLYQNWQHYCGLQNQYEQYVELMRKHENNYMFKMELKTYDEDAKFRFFRRKLNEDTNLKLLEKIKAKKPTIKLSDPVLHEIIKDISELYKSVGIKRLSKTNTTSRKDNKSHNKKPIPYKPKNISWKQRQNQQRNKFNQQRQNTYNVKPKNFPFKPRANNNYRRYNDRKDNSNNRNNYSSNNRPNNKQPFKRNQPNQNKGNTNKKELICYECQGKGHFARDCPSKRNLDVAPKPNQKSSHLTPTPKGTIKKPNNYFIQNTEPLPRQYIQQRDDDATENHTNIPTYNYQTNEQSNIGELVNHQQLYIQQQTRADNSVMYAQRGYSRGRGRGRGYGRGRGRGYNSHRGRGRGSYRSRGRYRGRGRGRYDN